MMTLMAVLCAAVSAFLLPKGTNTAAQRLRAQFWRSWRRARTPTRVDRGVQDPHRRWPDAEGRHPGRPTRRTWTRRSRAPDLSSDDSPHQERNGIRVRRPGEEGKPPRRSDVVLRRIAAGAAGVLCVVTLGGPSGALIGVLAAVGVWFSFGRLGSADRRRRRARLVADLPVAVDLLAACLRGGAPWHDAVAAVADAVGGPLGDELRAVSVQIRLGADPAGAWLALAEEPMLAPLARTAVRAASTGAALAPSLSRLARDQRRVARSAAAARARAAGIRALAPLGLCFLPAFVLLGVVPAIAGIASTILLPH